MLMKALPVEVWLHIASYIPKRQLQELRSLSSLFLDLALNARYAEIHVEDQDVGKIPCLKRLMDPLAGNRVKHLHIATDRREHKRDASGSGSWRMPAVLYWLIHSGSGLLYSSDSRESVPDVLFSLLEARVLTEVKELRVDSWQPASFERYERMAPLIWDSLGGSLQTLILGGQPANINKLLAPGVHCPSLQHLEFHLANYDANTDSSKALREGLVPFIQRHSSQLISLRLNAWTVINVSPLCNHCGALPQLRTFVLRTQFNDGTFPDTSGLTNLLHDQSDTLQHVELRLNPGSRRFVDPGTERRLSEWLVQIAEDERALSNLKSLQIYPTSQTVNGGFPSFITALRRSSDTLTTLMVRDRYMSYEEIHQVASIFAHRSKKDGLKKLRINIKLLTASVFDLLFEKLPGLADLTMAIGSLGSDGGSGEDATLEPEDMFIQDINKRCYHDWDLYSLSVWQAGAHLQMRAMRPLASAMPTVEDFWEEGPLPTLCET